MEATALLLDERFDRVMVRAGYNLSAPIRLRWKMLDSIRPFLLRNAPEFDSEIPKWQKENGTLINNRLYARGEPVLKHNATLLCECPMSWDDVEQHSRDASDLCVIYRPPSWRAHEEALRAWFPSGLACKRFAELVKASATPESAIAEACAIPASGTYAMADDAMWDALQVGADELATLRKRTMRVVNERKKYSHRFTLVHQLIPRIEPDDATLLPIYRAVTNLPSAGHVRLARDNVLGLTNRYWKLSLRALVRAGCIERKPTIGFYFFEGPEPDYERIQAEHVAAKGKFERMVKAVDVLPEYR